MARLSELSVDVNARLTVSDETCDRCLRLLEMWMDDKPGWTIVSERGADGHYSLRRKEYDHEW